jgi:hypothetical protein
LANPTGYSRLVSFVRSIARWQWLSVSARDDRPEKLFCEFDHLLSELNVRVA